MVVPAYIIILLLIIIPLSHIYWVNCVDDFMHQCLNTSQANLTAVLLFDLLDRG